MTKKKKKKDIFLSQSFWKRFCSTVCSMEDISFIYKSPPTHHIGEKHTRGLGINKANSVLTEIR